MKTKHFSDWLNLGGTVLGIGIAFFSVYQPLIAMLLGFLASICFFSAWLLARRERQHDAMAAERSLQKVDQDAKVQIQKVMHNADLLIQHAQDDAEQRIQEIEERFEEYENSVSAMDERWNDEL